MGLLRQTTLSNHLVFNLRYKFEDLVSPLVRSTTETKIAEKAAPTSDATTQGAKTDANFRRTAQSTLRLFTGKPEILITIRLCLLLMQAV